jgi:hypothetical protein
MLRRTTPNVVRFPDSNSEFCPITETGFAYILEPSYSGFRARFNQKVASCMARGGTKMQYPGPVEAKWWLKQSAEGMERLIEPQGQRSTAQDRKKAAGWWQSLTSTLGITNSNLRSLEPLEDKH